MKIRHFFLPLLLIFFVAACSSDDNGTDGPDGPDGPGTPSETANYFPNQEGNVWVYDNLRTADDGSTTAVETLKVETQTGNTSTFTTDVQGEAVGIMTGAIANGTITTTDDEIIFSGALDFIEFEGISLPINIENVVLARKGAETGTKLYEQNFAITTPFEFGDLGSFNISISLDIENKALGHNEVTTPNHYFSDAIVSELAIKNLNVTVQGTPLGDIPLISGSGNDALVITNYFADGAGIAKSVTNIDIQFVSLPPIPGLPELNPIEATLTQTLKDYTVVE